MCSTSVIEFFIENIDCQEFYNKRVIEVGSKYVNGSVRPLIEKFCKPKEYIGVDIEEGKFVDMIIPAEKLVEKFGENSFDVVISTEMIEHVKDWRRIINNMKLVLKPMGYIYITTRSFGFPYHAYPYDYWRYEVEDMQKIFADFEIIKLERDPSDPGVFLKARKPMNFKPKDLSEIALYSIIMGRRIRDIPYNTPVLRSLRIKFNEKFREIAFSFYNKLLSMR